MVKLYANLVLAGRRTIEQVPVTLRAAVIEYIESLKQGEDDVVQASS